MKFLKFLCLFSLILFLGSCASSKFDYRNAYKFSTYKTSSKKTTPVIQRSGEIQPLASLKPITLESNLPTLELPMTKAEYQKLSRSEKRQVRKELKRELKKVKRDYNKEYKDTKASGMNKWIYIGVVVGAAGLLLLIISVAETLGVIALVVGLGFIVYGFLKKGGAI